MLQKSRAMIRKAKAWVHRKKPRFLIKEHLDSLWNQYYEAYAYLNQARGTLNSYANGRDFSYYTQHIDRRTGLGTVTIGLTGSPQDLQHRLRQFSNQQLQGILDSARQLEKAQRGMKKFEMRARKYRVPVRKETSYWFPHQPIIIENIPLSKMN